MTLAQGSVVLVELDPTVGHEQRGVRRCNAEEPFAHLFNSDAQWKSRHCFALEFQTEVTCAS